MPQIAQFAETWSSQFFWLLVFFGLVYFIVGRGMVPKVMGTVETRDKQISDDLAAAQAARDAADEEEEAWRVRENENRASAQALVAQAKADAAKAGEKKLTAAQVRIDGKLVEAEARIETSRLDALAEIQTVAIEAAQDIVEQLAGAKVTRPAATAAVKKAMAHV